MVTFFYTLSLSSQLYEYNKYKARELGENKCYTIPYIANANFHILLIIATERDKSIHLFLLHMHTPQ